MGAADEEFLEFECWSSIFPNRWWDAINSCSFSVFICSVAFSVSRNVGSCPIQFSLAVVG